MTEETLFYQVLARPAGERSAFLEQACQGDAALRQHIEALLQAHEHPGSFLVKPAVQPEEMANSVPVPGGASAAPIARTIMEAVLR